MSVIPAWGISSVELSRDEISASDCVVVATDHSEMDLRPVVDFAPRVMDLRNAVRRKLGPSIPENVEAL